MFPALFPRLRSTVQANRCALCSVEIRSEMQTIRSLLDSQQISEQLRTDKLEKLSSQFQDLVLQIQQSNSVHQNFQDRFRHIFENLTLHQKTLQDLSTQMAVLTASDRHKFRLYLAISSFVGLFFSALWSVWPFLKQLLQSDPR